LKNNLEQVDELFKPLLTCKKEVSHFWSIITLKKRSEASELCECVLTNEWKPRLYETYFGLTRMNWTSIFS